MRDSADEWKGSYYANPSYDVPTTDEALIKEFPESCLPNIWPTADFPQLEPALKQLGALVVSVGQLVGRQCDRHVQCKLPEYKGMSLEQAIATSHTAKARLLHYFPIKEPGERERDSWCAWHNDHGSLTGLCPAMFQTVGDFDAEVNNPDPHAGLYVKTRAHKELRVVFPRDCKCQLSPWLHYLAYLPLYVCA